MGVQYLVVNKTIGLLTPFVYTILVLMLRSYLPDTLLHIDTHDTVWTGITFIFAATNDGADIVETSTNSMHGLTSQPALGGIVASVSSKNIDDEFNPVTLGEINIYRENVFPSTRTLNHYSFQ